MAEKPITTAPYSTGVSGNYYIFVNDNGELRQVDIDIISKFLGNISWSTLTGKPFNNVDGDEFTVSGETLKIKGYHTHNNAEILNNFALNEDGALVYDGSIIGGYVLPIATTEALGGVKPDGTTIKVDEDGTIHGANTYELPTATTEVLGGVKIDGDTIKINGGVISADVIGNWSAGVSYPVGYFVVYGEGMWECMVAHTSETTFDESKWMPVAFRAIKVYNWSANTDYYLYQLVIYNSMLYRAKEKHTSGSTFDESKWQLISGGTTGTTINNWSAQTDYVVGNLVINETTLYKCNTNHTSAETFDETESANWTVLSGAKGDKGDDGISPIASVEQTDTGCTITITDASGTTTANLTNGTDGADGVSPVANVTPTENGCVITVTDSSGTTTANLSNGVTPHIDETTKHWFIGDVDTGIVAEGVTTISTTSLEYTGILTVDGWVGDTAPYTQDITISGITSDLSPLIDLIVSDDVATSDEEIAQWSYITKATTGDNIITFRCNKTKPTIELNFKIKVV